MPTGRSPVVDRPELMTRGVARAGDTLRDARDRFIASDPGWARLRVGIRAVVAVGSSLVLEAGLASVLGGSRLLGALLGAVVAMLMSTGIREVSRTVIARTGLASPIAAAIGVLLGVVTAQQHPLGLLTFVAVSFVAVWIRRFGVRWFTLGFLLWQGFFFALFLHPPISQLPFLLVAVAASGIWVTLLLLTVLYDDPRAKLGRIVAAYRARARSAISATLDVLDHPDSRRELRAVRRELVQLSEIALLLDAQMADRRALPEGVTPGRLRRWTVDVEIAMDEVCGAVRAISGSVEQLQPATVGEIRELLTLLGWGDHDEAVRKAAMVAAVPDRAGPATRCDSDAATRDAATRPTAEVRRLGRAAGVLLATVSSWDTGDWDDPDRAFDARFGSESNWDDEDSENGEFAPVVTLVGGNLPGSAALAAQTISREDAGRWSVSRMSLTTRQAVQAAVAAGLAILAGEAISSQRFYWAVIAAFLGFAGTATSGETLSRGVARIAGTLVGLVAAVGLAAVTQGHPAAAVTVILFCIGLAFYAQPVSYGAMIFFITVLLGQLYTLLGTFSDGLLELRLLETVVGVFIGVLVALVVLPTHSWATMRQARRAFLTDLADLLNACAATFSGGRPEQDLLLLALRLDADWRQIARTRASLTRGRFIGADRDALRHRVSILHTCGAAARALAGSTAPGDRNAMLANVCGQLAEDARTLAAAPAISYAPSFVTRDDDPVGDLRSQLDCALGRDVGRGAGGVAARSPDGGGVGTGVGGGPAGPVTDDTDRLTAQAQSLRRLGDALALLSPAGQAATTADPAD